MSAFDPKWFSQPNPFQSARLTRYDGRILCSCVAVIRDPKIGPGIGQFGVSAFMPRSLQDLVVFAAPGVFVVLWASGIIGAKLGLAYAEPLTFLALRMGIVVVLLGAILSLTRPKWPNARGVAHSVVTGLMVHGLCLGGVFVSIENGLSAGIVALVLSLQPALTSTIASPWLGERVRPLQWVGLALGLLGVYLIVRDRAAIGSATPFAWLASAVAPLPKKAPYSWKKSAFFRTGVGWPSCANTASPLPRPEGVGHVVHRHGIKDQATASPHSVLRPCPGSTIGPDTRIGAYSTAPGLSIRSTLSLLPAQ
jgi:uncharacterized membrane protein